MKRKSSYKQIMLINIPILHKTAISNLYEYTPYKIGAKYSHEIINLDFFIFRNGDKNMRKNENQIDLIL